MASENENKNRETVADIVAMVRRAAQYYEGEAEKSEGLLRESFEMSAANYRAIANLVEAAWKREKAEWEAAACAFVSDAVMSGKVAVEHAPVGNAAAMREALENLWKEVYFYAFDEEKQDFKHLQEAMLEDPPDYKSLRNSFFAIAHLVDSALSAPPRNCDRFKTGKEAKYRFLQVAELPEGNGDADMREWYRKLIAWLFEPAAERTGEENEND